MGDYTKNGTKIGTCGGGYYATLAALQKLAENPAEEEARYCIDPKNKCSFAFPFPANDGKKVGEVNYRNEGEYFELPATLASYHEKMSLSVPHAVAGRCPIYVAFDCPHEKTGQTKGFIMRSVAYGSDSLLHIGVTCAYCGAGQTLDEEDIYHIVNWFAENEKPEIAQRILNLNLQNI